MSDARQKCQGMNADLPIINSFEENTFIAELLKEQGAEWSWIGLQRSATNSEFYWVDGTPLGYGAWKSGEPNNDRGKENCAYIEAHTQCERPSCRPGGWNDIHCEVESPAVLCQKAM